MVNHPNRSKQLMTTTAIDPDFVVTIHAYITKDGKRYISVLRGDHQKRFSDLHRGGYHFVDNADWQVMICDCRDLASEIVKWFGIGWLSIAKKSIREFEKRHGMIPQRETAA
jgi:hypothetical protein